MLLVPKHASSAPGWKAEYGYNLPVHERLADLVKAESYMRASTTHEEHACLAPIIEIWKSMVRAIYGDHYVVNWSPSGSPQKEGSAERLSSDKRSSDVQSSGRRGSEAPSGQSQQQREEVEKKDDASASPLSQKREGGRSRSSSDAARSFESRTFASRSSRDILREPDDDPHSSPPSVVDTSSGSRAETPPTTTSSGNRRAVNKARLVDLPPQLPPKAAFVEVDLQNPPQLDARMFMNRGLVSLSRTEQYNRQAILDHEESSWANTLQWHEDQLERKREQLERDPVMPTAGPHNPHHTIQLIQQLRKNHLDRLISALVDEEAPQRQDIIAEYDIVLQHSVVVPSYSGLLACIARQEARERLDLTVEQERVFRRDTGALFRLDSYTQALLPDFVLAAQSLLRDAMLAIIVLRQEREAVTKNLRELQRLETLRRSEHIEHEVVVRTSYLDMQSVVTLSDRLYSTTALKMGFFYVDVAEQLEREHVIVVAQNNTRTLLQSVLEPAEKTVIHLAQELKEEKIALLEESVLRAVIKASTVLGEQERLAREEIDRAEDLYRDTCSSLLLLLFATEQTYISGVQALASALSEDDARVQSYFAAVNKEPLVIQQAFRNLHFKTQPSPIEELDLNATSMTAKTVEFIAETIGKARTRVDRVILHGGHRDAVVLLKLDCRHLEVVRCGIRDEDFAQHQLISFLEHLEQPVPDEEDVEVDHRGVLTIPCRFEHIDLSRNFISDPEVASAFISLAKRVSSLTTVLLHDGVLGDEEDDHEGSVSSSSSASDRHYRRLLRVLKFVTDVNRHLYLTQKLQPHHHAAGFISPSLRRDLIDLAESTILSPETNAIHFGQVVAREGLYLTSLSGDASMMTPCRRRDLLQLLLAALSLNHTVTTINLSFAGIVDDDVTFHIIPFVSDARIAPQLHLIDLSSNLLSKETIKELQAAIRGSGRKPPVSVLTSGNLHGADIESSVEETRHEFEDDEAALRRVIEESCRHLAATWRQFFAEEEKKQLETNADVLAIEDNISVLQRLNSERQATLGEMEQERETLEAAETHEFDDITDAEFSNRSYCENFVRSKIDYLGELDRLEEAARLCLFRTFATFATAVEEQKDRATVVAECSLIFSQVLTRTHQCAVQHEVLWREFKSRSNEIFADCREHYEKRRNDFLRQPKALREALLRISTDGPQTSSASSSALPQRSSPKKGITLDLSHTRHANDEEHAPAAINIELIHAAIVSSQETAHPIRHLSLRNCVGLMDMDTALPALLDLCPLLESIDLTNCGLANRHVDALCEAVTHPTSNSSVRRIVLENNALGPAAYNIILHAIKTVNPESSPLEEISIGDIAVPLSQVHPQSQTAELLQSISFFNRLNKKVRSTGFKAKVMAMYDNHPFFTVGDFSIPTHVRAQAGAISTTTPYRIHGSSGVRHGTTAAPVGPSSQASSRDNSPNRALSAVRLLFSDPNNDHGGVLPPLFGFARSDYLHVVDDDLMEFVLTALARNTHLQRLLLAGNDITDVSVHKLIALVGPMIDVTALQEVDVANCLASENCVNSLSGLFCSRTQKWLREHVIEPEEAARALLSSSLMSEFIVGRKPFQPMADYLRRIAPLEMNCRLRKRAAVADLSFSRDCRICIAEEDAARSVIRDEYDVFSNVAGFWIDFVVKLFSCEKDVSRRKSLVFEESCNKIDNTSKIIEVFQPGLRATARHVARDNPFVNVVDMSADAIGISLEDRPGYFDDAVEAMSFLLRRNTNVVEMTFANAGPYINSNRSVPIMAEIGVRLEALDLTNCGVTDSLVGSLVRMVADPNCKLTTLNLNCNRISAKGIQKLTKAIRASSTLSDVSIDENPQLPRDAHHLIRFYCDLNKFTPAFKETILRVEANDPTLTEINFERRGNTDEKTIFDDTSMRLLCAALPHNTNLRRLFISGNHVTDDGAMILLTLLKANVNRSLFYVDLSGNDISNDILDELDMIRLNRTFAVVRVEVFVPEGAGRERILLDEADVRYLIGVSADVLEGVAKAGRDCRKRKERLLGACEALSNIVLAVHAPEGHARAALEQDEDAARQAIKHVAGHCGSITAMADLHHDMCQQAFEFCLGGYHSVRHRLDDQPNAELRRIAVHVATNDPSVTRLDLSSAPQNNEFFIADPTTSLESVDIALQLLSKNTNVGTIDFSNNLGLPEDAYERILKLHTRMHSINLSNCGLTDEFIPSIIQAITAGDSVLVKLILDGNNFTNEGAKRLEQVIAKQLTTSARHRLKLVSVKKCPMVFDVTQKSVEFACDLNQCPEEVRSFISDVAEHDPETVDSSSLPLTDAQMKLLSFVLTWKCKRTIVLKLYAQILSDNSATAIAQSVRQKDTILRVQLFFSAGMVDEIIENPEALASSSGSQISERVLREILGPVHLRLQRRIDQEVVFTEETSRALVEQDWSVILSVADAINGLRKIFEEHHKQVGLALAVSISGQKAVQSVVIPEKIDREHISMAEMEARRELKKLYVFLGKSAQFFATVLDRKSAFLSESRASIAQIVALLPGLPMELRLKAFHFALNDPTATSLDLSAAYSDKCMWVLSKVLRMNQYCTSLNFSSSDIRLGYALPLLAEAKCNVEVIDLSNCDLDDAKLLDPLREFLCHPDCQLYKLIVDRNKITANSINSIATTVRDTNHTLVEFSARHNRDMTKLRQNTMDFYCELNRYVHNAKSKGKKDEYIKNKHLLIDCQSNKPTVTTLNLANEEDGGSAGTSTSIVLDDQFAKLVCIALSNNTYVRCVNLRRHALTDRGAEYFLQLMRGINFTLQSVMLEGNMVSPTLMMQIEQAAPMRELEELCQKELASAIAEAREVYIQHERALLNSCDQFARLWMTQMENRLVLEDQESALRIQLKRFAIHLRYYDAWVKSYLFSFEKEYKRAYVLLPNITAQALERADVLATLRQTYGTDPLFHAMPRILRDRFDRFVFLTHLYEQKCNKIREGVWDRAVEEAKRRRRSSTTRIEVEYRDDAADAASMDYPDNDGLDFASTALRSSPSFISRLPPGDEFSPLANQSFSYDTANGGDERESSRRRSSIAATLTAYKFGSKLLTPARARQQSFSPDIDDSTSGEYSPISRARGNSSERSASLVSAPSFMRGSTFGAAASYDPFGNDDPAAVQRKLDARYAIWTERFAEFEVKCTGMKRTCFQNFANSLPNVFPVHGPNCKASCICSPETKARINKTNLLDEKLLQRFNKYCEQSAKFSEFCLQALEQVFVQTVREMPKIPAPKRRISFDGAALNAKLEARLEKYLAALKNFETRCIAAQQETFDSHVANNFTTLNAMRRASSVAKHPLEAKLENRFIAYSNAVSKFEEKCRVVKKDAFDSSCSRYGLDKIPQYTTSSSSNNLAVSTSGSFFGLPPDANAGGMAPQGSFRDIPLVSSAQSTPTTTPMSPPPSHNRRVSSVSIIEPGSHPLVHKLMERFNKYVQASDGFEVKCRAAVAALYGSEEEKVKNLRSSDAFSPTLDRYSSMYGGSTPFPTRQRSDLAPSTPLQRGQSVVGSMVASPLDRNRSSSSLKRTVSEITDPAILEVIRMLPHQPPELRERGRAIAGNDSTIDTMDLSESVNKCLMTDTHLHVAWTLLSRNTNVKKLRLSTHFADLNSASMTRIGRLSIRLTTLDLSHSRGVSDMVVNKLIIPILGRDTLDTLILDDVELTSDQAAAILAALRQNVNKLTSLSLRSNPKVEQGLLSYTTFYTDVNKFVPASDSFKPTVVALEANSNTLKSAVFAGQHPGTGFINDVAVRLLCISLSQNQHLKELNLANSQVTDRGLKNLVTLLKDLNNATALKYLNLSGGRFSTEGIMELTKVVTQHRPKLKLIA